ncbi:hypothetical protein Cgig2_025058 [Carnegiea gigantea]|uniref:Replication factor A C-terminal domain-containing protein n=1 Tax=Carnegiea gigantea TaxID=171969 RepID=A0A9Q1GQ30_9CARY|nr:hypothetical protein Cgig2_025058 [Carnegiea gigantea]
MKDDKKEYEISNAVVKPIKKEMHSRAEKYEMEFNNRTVIRPLFKQSEVDEIRMYCAIADIDCDPQSTERYGNVPYTPYSSCSLFCNSRLNLRCITSETDYCRVVLYLEPTRMKRIQPHEKGEDREVAVREIVLVDESYKGKETLIASIWSDLAVNDGDKLSTLLEMETFPVMTALKCSRHKGTFIYVIHSLMVSGRNEQLTTLREHERAARSLTSQVVMTTIAELKEKKPFNTGKSEQIWITGSIPCMEKKQVRIYLGCDKCGKKSNEDIGVKYACFNCNHQNSTSIPRITFTFELVDATCSREMTLFSQHASKILSIEPDVLYKMDDKEREKFLNETTTRLAKDKVYIKLVPAPTFAVNKILRWNIEEASLEEPSSAN